MSSGIYCLQNKKNGRRYIGSTIDLHRRKLDHFRGSHNKRLKKDLSENGIENFSFEVLERVSPEKLKNREKYWQLYYKSYEKDLGYNGAHLVGKKQKKEGKVLNIVFSEELHLELKVKSVREKTTMNELVVQAIKEFLEKGKE